MRKTNIDNIVDTIL